MKIKKLSSVKIILILTLIAYIVATLTFCYTTKPEVAKGEFPFSITYEYKGETKTLTGVMKCEYSGSYTIWNEHRRYWDSEDKYINPENPEYPHIIEQNDELQTTLAVQADMSAGYFMGDPLYKDYYSVYGREKPEPYIEYYDYKNDISLNDENKDEVLASIGFKIVDFTYAEPIENKFYFSGIQYKADNVMIFVLIFVLFFLACLIFVRKNTEYKYSKLDTVGIVFNFLIGIFAVPFITIFCFFFGIIESSIEIVNQIVYNIPSISILCLGLSVVLRRKGFSKTGFFIQFTGVVLFALIFVFDAIVYYF